MEARGGQLKDATMLFSGRKLFGVLAAATMLAVVVAAPAVADQYSNNSTPGFTVNPGVGPRFDDTYNDEAAGGNFPVVGNFNDVTMNGTPQLTSATIDPFVVIDDSGSGNGWKVTLQVTQFTGVTVTNHVPSTGMSMNPPVVAPGTSGSAMGGVWGRGWTDFQTSARHIVEADPTDPAIGGHNGGAPTVDGVAVAGMGTYLVSPQILKLVVPVNAHADTYTATATIAVSSGP
jgi:hypothetical protein